MGEGQNDHEAGAVVTPRSVMALVAGAAVGLRLAYVASLLWFSQDEWLGMRHGSDMRQVAVANLILMAMAVGGLLAGVPRLVWLTLAAALATTAMPGAGAGFVSAGLLPWVTATTAAAMLIVASRCGRTDLVIALAILPLVAGLVVYREAWASVGFAVAGLAVMLAGSAFMLLRSARLGHGERT